MSRTHKSLEATNALRSKQWSKRFGYNWEWDWKNAEAYGPFGFMVRLVHEPRELYKLHRYDLGENSLPYRKRKHMNRKDRRFSYHQLRSQQRQEITQFLHGKTEDILGDADGLRNPPWYW